jgi:hypothetical protein
MISIFAKGISRQAVLPRHLLTMIVGFSYFIILKLLSEILFILLSYGMTTKRSPFAAGQIFRTI